jgi:Glycosyltransferase family 9 (heptosyltransferase)
VAAPEFAEAHFEAAMTHLTLGDFDTGWKQYEWRWKTGAFARYRRPFRAPPWLGNESVAGKTVLLHAEQGFGDTIQFIRYAPLAARQGADVILEVQPALKALMREIVGVSVVIGRGEELPRFDFHCPLLSLPFAFKTDLATIPGNVPYLVPPTDRVAKWQGRLQQRKPLRVGIAWAGSASYQGDENRSIALGRLAPLWSDQEIEFVSIQREPRPADGTLLQGNPHLLHVGPDLEDFGDTAAVISLLDVVVSIDTSVAHLAGALGKPVLIMLPYSPDFRWMLDRDDSPWYPTARLFRQRRRGDWDSVVERVRQELALLHRLPQG